MTFEQWWSSYQPPSKKPFTVTIAKAAWDAALASNQTENNRQHPMFTGTGSQPVVCHCHMCTQARLTQLERAALKEPR
jgi:hypothetical protein